MVCHEFGRSGLPALCEFVWRALGGASDWELGGAGFDSRPRCFMLGSFGDYFVGLRATFANSTLKSDPE